MTAISSVTPYNHQQQTKKQQATEKTEKVAAGVGGAAGLTKTATNMASKRGILATEKTFQGIMGSVTNGAQTITEGTQQAVSLWSKFKNNTKIFTADILRRFKALESTKFIGKIIKSPIAKKAAGIFGGALAFFVLVTGVNKAVKTGIEAAGDVKSKLETWHSAA